MAEEMEYTLAMIKPDAVAAGKASEIQQLAEMHGFLIIAKRQLQVPAYALDNHKQTLIVVTYFISIATQQLRHVDTVRLCFCEGCAALAVVLSMRILFCCIHAAHYTPGRRVLC
jgi:nucleoside diphosphate kinase